MSSILKQPWFLIYDSQKEPCLSCVGKQVEHCVRACVQKLVALNSLIVNLHTANACMQQLAQSTVITLQRDISDNLVAIQFNSAT